MKLRRLFVQLAILLFVAIGNCAYSQVSEGGTPPSFTYGSGGGTKTQQLKTVYKAEINFKVEDLLEEDNAPSNTIRPYRIGKLIPLNLNFKNSGEWTTLANGTRIWRLAIKAQGAIATSLYYDEFYIPKGGKLFIYNKAKTQILGAYNETTNVKGGAFATELVAGDEVILEYVEPNVKNPEMPRILLSDINYAYTNVEIQSADLNVDNYFPIGGSVTCMININCSEGNNWQDHKKGVALMLYPIGNNVSACSGSIINSFSENFEPFFLTAGHCVYDNATATIHGGFDKAVFYFHYENLHCYNTNVRPATTKTLVGGSVLVYVDQNSKSDGALMVLNQEIPKDYDVYYNGWDCSDNPQVGSVSIHHPAGDVKKISTFAKPLLVGAPGLVPTAPRDGFWVILNWDHTPNGQSLIEKGSSGAPLFNNEGLIVGTVSGGEGPNGAAVVCGGTGLISYYGRLFSHYNYTGIDGKTTFKDYLDPDNTGAKTCRGMYKNKDLVASFVTNKKALEEGGYVNFLSTSLGAETYEWEFQGGTPSTSTEKNPKITYSTAGNYKVTLTINKGTANEKIKTVENYILVSNKKHYCPASVAIGNGTSVSSYPLGREEFFQVSSSIYTPEEVGGGGIITNMAWYADKELSSQRTFFIILDEVDSDEQAAVDMVDHFSTGHNYLQVYKSMSFNFVNQKGWNEVLLGTSYNYSGTKNLRVTTISQARTRESPVGTSDCRYTVSPNKHVYWTNSVNELPQYEIGTVNDKRPNIKITINRECTNINKPDFTNGKQIISFEENFESGTMPTGWSYNEFLNNRGNRQASFWKVGTIEESRIGARVEDFSQQVDPTSKYILYSPADVPEFADLWLYTSEYQINDGEFVEFDYSHLKASEHSLALFFYVSIDGGDTWILEWTTGEERIPEAGYHYMSWKKATVDLAKYAGKKVKFALEKRKSSWVYEGLAIDNFKIYKHDYTPIHIFEGDKIIPRNLSSGSPSSISWTFEGGIPEKSTEFNPGTIQYFKAGTYKVSLTTTLGADGKTETKEGIVIVEKQKPVADFSWVHAKGYTRKSDWGAFLPSHQDVDFIMVNKSTNYPTNYAWTFTNATPSSSNEVLPIVKFSNSGTVNLKSSNSVGVSELTKDIKITSSYDVDTIWNMPAGDDGTHLYMQYLPMNGGNMSIATGGFSVAMGKLYEKFAAPMKPIEMLGLDILLYKTHANVSGTLEITIHEGSPTGKILYFKSESYRNIPAGTNTYKIRFDAPIGITSEFWVRVNPKDQMQMTQEPLATVAVYSSKPRVDGISTLYSTGLSSGAFITAKRTFGVDLSMNIAPIIKYLDINIDKDYITKKIVDDTNDAVIVQTNATNWDATPSAAWIKVDKFENFITIKCSNNIYDSRRGYVVIKCAGIEKYVTIEQQGIAPNTLLAEVVGEGENDVKMEWKSANKPQPGIDMFDGIEDHNTFVVNSPGPLGFSYIDGDNLATVKISTFDFPSEGSKMAFYVYNPTKTNPNVQSTVPTHGKGFQALMNIPGVVSEAAQTVKADDWLITPEITADGEYTFSFWARCITTASTKFYVYYSTTGKAKANFTELLSSAPGESLASYQGWKKYTYTVPKEAKYAAININHTNLAITMIDDIYIGQGISPQSARAESNLQANEGVQNFDLAFEFNTPSNDVEDLNKPQLSLMSTNKVVKSTSQSSIDSWIPLRYDTEVGLTSLVSPGAKLAAAIKFSYLDLINYYNSDLKTISFMPMGTGNSFIIKIYKDDNLAYTQTVVDYIPEAFNNINLLNPLKLDVKSNLMIVIEATMPKGEPFIALDESTSIPGKGTLVSLNDQKFAELGTYTGIYKGNWKIVAYIQPDNQQSYNIYREGEKIINTPNLSYFDSNIPVSKSLCYQISKINNSMESALSSAACVHFKTPLYINGDNIERYYSQPNPVASYNITGFESGDNVNMLTTKPTANIDNNVYNPTISTGVYSNAIEVTGAEDNSGKYRFIYQNGSLTVKNQHVLTVKADDIERSYGLANPDLTGKYLISGFVDGETSSVLSTLPTVTIDNLLYGYDRAAGTYNNAVVVSGAEDNTYKYAFTYENGNLIIKQNYITEGSLVAVEGFSPNGDNMNDNFTVHGYDPNIVPAEFIVFDRSGSIAYQTKDFQNTWDGIGNTGRFKGEKLPSGTYYYILKVKGLKEIKSFVVIRY